MYGKKEFDSWAVDYDSDINSCDNGCYPFAGYGAALKTAAQQALGGSSVLDLGVGTGNLSKQLYDAGLAVTGVDFSRGMLDAAAAKMPDARLLEGDLSVALPSSLAGEKFSAIVSGYMFHHLCAARQLELIAEARTLLAPGGVIAIADVAFPNRAALERCRTDAGDEWDAEETYIVYSEFSGQLKESSFTPVSFCGGVLVCR